MRSLKNPAIIPFVVTVGCLLPFAWKAVHIDDPIFIWCAKQILSAPLDFYGFTANWYGTEMGMWEMHHNPPGACYYMALAGLLFGWGEVALHIFFLIPAAAAALGTYYLARLLDLRTTLSALAALAAVLTPGFLVSGTTLMCDMMMLSLWVWAAALWIQGIKDDKQLKLLCAAILISICIFTRYVGISLVPLLFVYSFVRRRKPGIWMLYLLVPVATLAGYLWAANALYGKGLLSQAASFAVNMGWKGKAGLLTKALTGLSFAGGCILTVLFYIPLLWSRRVLTVGVVLTTLFVLALNSVEQISGLLIRDGDGQNWIFSIQVALTAVSGISLLGLAGMDLHQRRDADSLLLLLWVVGIYVFSSFINWTVNARSVLPMAPAAGILLMRRIDQRCKVRQQEATWKVAWPLVPAALVALSVAWTDYSWANSARRAATEIHQTFDRHPGNVWFQGHWGFQYYMEANGHLALDFRRSKVAFGDIVIIPSNNCFTLPLPKKVTHLVKTFNATPCQWMATMNPSLGAGFYSSLWGPLPFAAGPVRPEKYHAYLVK